MRTACLTQFTLLAVCALTSTAHAQPSAAPRPIEPEQPVLDERDVNLGFPDSDADQVTRLIEQLGDPEFTKREEASQELADLCPGAFRRMARAYREGDDYEARIRIQEIVQQQYMWHTLLKHNGFLGVSYDTTATHETPEGSHAVLIRNVVSGFAADEAGLRDNDLIISIDGERFSSENGNNEFRDRIQAKGASGKAVLEVVRGNESLMVEVTLRARPIEQYTDRGGSTLLDDLNARIQEFAVWWNRNFAIQSPKTERTPSTAVLELPE